MLDYAQIRAGKLRKNISKFSIKDCFEKIVNINLVQAQAKGLEISQSYLGFDDDEYIRSDEQRLS